LVIDTPCGGTGTCGKCRVQVLEGAPAASAADRQVFSSHELQTADLKSVLIAGGFGTFIRREHAQRIGLLPPELDIHRIHYVGNVSLAGAKRALLSIHARQQSEALARRAQHIELSTDANFQMQFAESMIFPDAPYLTV